jgi:hypothetical protein
MTGINLLHGEIERLFRAQLVDTLPGYTLSINMEVPLDTNVSKQNDSAVLFTRRIDGGLVVRNGVVQPVLIASGR